jgi:hypothetical protein
LLALFSVACFDDVVHGVGVDAEGGVYLFGFADEGFEDGVGSFAEGAVELEVFGGEVGDFVAVVVADAEFDGALRVVGQVDGAVGGSG